MREYDIPKTSWMEGQSTQTMGIDTTISKIPFSQHEGTLW